MCPAWKQIWDVPASAKAGTGAEIVEETSCALLLLDLDDRNSLRVAKRWQTMITEGEGNKVVTTNIHHHTSVSSQFEQKETKIMHSSELKPRTYDYIHACCCDVNTNKPDSIIASDICLLFR